MVPAAKVSDSSLNVAKEWSLFPNASSFRWAANNGNNMGGRLITINDKRFEVNDWTEKYSDALKSPTGKMVVGTFRVTLHEGVDLGALVSIDDGPVQGIVELISPGRSGEKGRFVVSGSLVWLKGTTA